MAEAGPKKKRPSPKQLRVVFDTNALYTQSGSDLVRQEIAGLIESSVFPDLQISWYLPEIVRHERQFQMQTKALEWLQAVPKLERILEHQLNITEGLVIDQVKKVVEKRCQALAFQELRADFSLVDWNRLMLDAVYRRPPFQLGDKEKGFRDALLVEAFTQLVAESPKSPQVCRVVLISADALVKEAVEARISETSNVAVLHDIEALKGLVNTLISQVDEAFIEMLKPKASKLFFITGEREDTLFFKEGIVRLLQGRFTKELASKPKDTGERKNGNWTVYPPNFVRKDGQRVFWSTRIEVSVEMIRTNRAITPEIAQVDWTQLWAPSPTASVRLSSLAGIAPTYDPTVSKSILGISGISGISGDWMTGIAGPTTSTTTHKGKDVYSVLWSVEVTISKNLRKPRIEEITHTELALEQV